MVSDFYAPAPGEVAVKMKLLKKYLIFRSMENCIILIKSMNNLSVTLVNN